MQEFDFTKDTEIKTCLNILDNLQSFQDRHLEELIIVAYNALVEANEYINRQKIIDGIKYNIEHTLREINRINPTRHRQSFQHGNNRNKRKGFS